MGSDPGFKKKGNLAFFNFSSSKTKNVDSDCATQDVNDTSFFNMLNLSTKKDSKSAFPEQKKDLIVQGGVTHDIEELVSTDGKSLGKEKKKGSENDDLSKLSDDIKPGTDEKNEQSQEVSSKGKEEDKI